MSRIRIYLLLKVKKTSYHSSIVIYCVVGLHYKLPLGLISKLVEHKIIFFEVLLEGFNANKAKKFEKQSFVNMEK